MLGAFIPRQLVEMEEPLSAVLFTAADGKRALECLTSVFKCPEWKWARTLTSVHWPELITWSHSTTRGQRV